MRTARSIVAVLAAALLLTACFTGKRAHFTDTTATTSAAVTDPAIQAVVSKLETPNTEQFTATYSVITKFGNTTTSAIVAQTSGTAQSVTIGHVRFLFSANGWQTCELTTGTCVDGAQDQQVSDLQMTHEFAGASPALRMRQDVNTMVNAALASTKTVAGQTATCAEVFFAAGSKTYCALDNGLLAQQDTPDLRIDLLTLTAGADQTLFATSGAVTSPSTTVTGAVDSTSTTVVGG